MVAFFKLVVWNIAPSPVQVIQDKLSTTAEYCAAQLSHNILADTGSVCGNTAMFSVAVTEKLRSTTQIYTTDLKSWYWSRLQRLHLMLGHLVWQPPLQKTPQPPSSPFKYMKMEPTGSSKILVHICQITWHHIWKHCSVSSVHISLHCGHIWPSTQGLGTTVILALFSVHICMYITFCRRFKIWSSIKWLTVVQLNILQWPQLLSW